VLLQAPEIIFEVQMRRSNEKKTRRKISYLTYKAPFFFLLFRPLLLLNFITFLFLIHFKRFLNAIGIRPKVLQIIFDSNSNRSTYEEFFGCLGTGFGTVW
jgi:uncharacterized membrane protein